jgi:hypothetical protein
MLSMAEALPTAEELEIERLLRAKRLGRGLRVAARRALALARRYREEEGPGGAREAACVKQALAWRASARDLRDTGTSVDARPGLARTSPTAADAKRRAG